VTPERRFERGSGLGQSSLAQAQSAEDRVGLGRLEGPQRIDGPHSRLVRRFGQALREQTRLSGA
jgi:hypothetical protein